MSVAFSRKNLPIWHVHQSNAWYFSSYSYKKEGVYRTTLKSSVWVRVNGAEVHNTYVRITSENNYSFLKVWDNGSGLGCKQECERDGPVV